MADPRVVDFTGLAPKAATYKIDNSTITYDVSKANGSAAVGLAVTLSADGTVALAADGEAIEGKLLKVEPDNTATVQYGGFVTFAGGNGASLTRGKKIVGALNASSAKGYIREVNTATAAELGRCRGRIIANGTTTAVVVALE